ncbi:hypothetical protein [Mycolicibacterium frederiksbergense]|uniref:hypothetical protein n=1 Tax=Mycolicibacterium frederiksbergense TaxID=117567 RepID=UPI00265C1A32|nr:hypothetical protein [Mycolicibacterium frederiksbergense]MDO0976942.1 hypothetical protein [Mycolicibacterium frederiksbergense]
MSNLIPEPAGAATVDPWDDRVDHDGPVRNFVGSSWQIPCPRDDGNPVSPVAWLIASNSTITVDVRGVQRHDGRIYRWTQIDFAGAGANIDVYDLPVPVARMLAESLAAAVTEAERMCIADGGVMSSYPIFSATEV